MARKDRHENLGWGKREPKRSEEPVSAAQSKFGNIFARVFCLPHMLIGVWLAYMCVINVMPIVFGTNVEGRVETLAPHEGKRHTTYKVTYNFSEGDKTFKNVSTVDRSYYLSLKEGSPVPVRYWTLAKEASAYITYPGYNHLNGFLLFFTLFWDSIVGLFFFALYLAPLMVALGIWKQPVNFS